MVLQKKSLLKFGNTFLCMFQLKQDKQVMLKSPTSLSFNARSVAEKRLNFLSAFYSQSLTMQDSRARFPSFPALTLRQRSQSTFAGINCTCLNIRLIRLSGIIYFYTDNSQLFWKMTHFIFAAAKTHRIQRWHEQGCKFGSVELIIAF